MACGASISLCFTKRARQPGLYDWSMARRVVELAIVESISHERLVRACSLGNPHRNCNRSR